MQRLSAWLPDNPDETVLRWIFRCVVSVTVAVLAADLAGMNASVGNPDASEIKPEPVPAAPALLPSLLAPLLPDGDRRLVQVPEPKGPLANPMNFELVGGGRLMATGTITPGISQAFAAEIQKRGDYIRTVVLDSPGGSVADALAMGRLIRDRKFATEVEPGKFCASSCPLVFAGGIERRAGDRATIGVHQIAAVSQDRGPPRDEMSLAQKVSARCQRYLGDMGVDLQVWIHAMETPHDKLFVFKPDELKSLSLVTAPLATGGPLPPGVAKSRS
ncbi:hypothetical protein [Bradyrhizobium sp.]|uniref:COG3904 family protein n=1 Tax=Bradyrhizobium sp. TaxID=376 RepID=UPI0025C32067|nr:hypothetical protein [Bradyrhizobium sp.]